MAKHYSPTRREAYRANESKRREIADYKRSERRDKLARREYENGGR
jgi:hypothetical protein